VNFRGNAGAEKGFSARHKRLHRQSRRLKRQVVSVDYIGYFREYGLIVEPQFQLSQTLPDQAVKVFCRKIAPDVSRTRAQQLGHRVTPVIERQFTQALAALLL
jgi:hypothetical protein